MRLISSLSTLMVVATLSAPLLASSSLHEDDPKILSRQAPYVGPGYRNTMPSQPGGGTTYGGFDSDNVQLLSWMTLSELSNASEANDCWGYTAPSGREYAIIGTHEETCFVEISNPGNPQLVGVIDGNDSLWRDPKVYQDHAYMVTENGSGIQVVSMANIDSGVVTLVNTIDDVGSSNTHNVVIDEDSGFLYRTGGSNHGLRIYSLANPASPAYVGSWDDRYIHDAQVVTYTSGPYAGKQVAFCCSGFNGGWDQTGLDVLDVTNKSNIILMDRVFYPAPAYSHQGWLSEDRQHFYLGDELDEDGTLTTRTHVFDVNNLNNVNHVGFFSNGNQAVGHNMYTKNGLLFQANYRSGLRVFDIDANATNPPEVAYFDTYPGSDADDYNGLWSCFPYFDSGVVIGSDRERGLFVLWVGDAAVDISLNAPAPFTLDPSGEDIGVTITEGTPGALVTGSANLVYDAGAGTILVPLTHVAGDQFLANFPAFPCGTAVSWYVQAQSQGGLAWNEPATAPGSQYSSIAAEGANNLFSYNMESVAGWSSGAAGDTATTGIWTRVNPVGTSAQPEDDHSQPGTNCWVTGQGVVGGGLGDNDIDGGTTTLLSATLDLSNASSPTISYWRWYSNDQNGTVDDSLVIDISPNGNNNWTNVETIGPGHPEASGGWFQHTFEVAPLVNLTANVRLRFRASDGGGGSIVEAAIDDLSVDDVLCTDCNANGVPDSLDISNGTSTDNNSNGIPDECECGAESYCTALTNSTGNPATISLSGSVVVADNAFGLYAYDLPPTQVGVFFYGPAQSQSSFGNGNLCVTGGFFRLPVVSVSVLGDIQYNLDLTNPPGMPAQINAGSNWNFQFWYRDPAAGGAAYNLTDGLSVTFCP
ncbi:MAG: choice-of-anchor B domain-containing protein [Planctomycetota bacterium]|jgi:choice-of-anchor B domain-containing protein